MSDLEQRLREGRSNGDLAADRTMRQAADRLRQYREAFKTIMDKTGDCEACWEVLDTARTALKETTDVD